jgi:hypothetical protein
VAVEDPWVDLVIKEKRVTKDCRDTEAEMVLEEQRVSVETLVIQALEVKRVNLHSAVHKVKLVCLVCQDLEDLMESLVEGVPKEKKVLLEKYAYEHKLKQSVF